MNRGTGYLTLQTIQRPKRGLGLTRLIIAAMVLLLLASAVYGWYRLRTDPPIDLLMRAFLHLDRYDMASADITLIHSSEDSSISVRADIEVVPTSRSGRLFVFALSDSLRITGLQINGERARAFRLLQARAVLLSRDVAGEAFTLTVEYEGSPRSLLPAFAADPFPEGEVILREHHLWLPFQHNQETLSTLKDIAFVSDDPRLRLVSAGSHGESTEEGAQVAYGVDQGSFIAVETEHQSYSLEGLSVDLHLFIPEDYLHMGPALAEWTRIILGTYTERYGAQRRDYGSIAIAFIDSRPAFCSGDLITIPTSYLSSVRSEQEGDSLIPLSRESRLYSVLAHELAHLWWTGSDVSTFTGYQWYVEGLAEYSEILSIRDAYGVERYREEIERKRSRLARQPEIRAMTDYAYHEYSIVPYYKGVLMQRALHGFLGEEGYFAFLRAVNERDELMVTRELMEAAALEATGVDVSLIFEYWLSAPEPTTLRAKSVSYEDMRLNLEVDSSGNLPFGVPIRITGYNPETMKFETIYHTFPRNASGYHSLTLPILPGSVELDPNGLYYSLQEPPSGDVIFHSASSVVSKDHHTAEGTDILQVGAWQDLDNTFGTDRVTHHLTGVLSTADSIYIKLTSVGDSQSHGVFHPSLPLTWSEGHWFTGGSPTNLSTTTREDGKTESSFLVRYDMNWSDSSLISPPPYGLFILGERQRTTGLESGPAQTQFQVHPVSEVEPFLALIYDDAEIGPVHLRSIRGLHREADSRLEVTLQGSKPLRRLVGVSLSTEEGSLLPIGTYTARQPESDHLDLSVRPDQVLSPATPLILTIATFTASESDQLLPTLIGGGTVSLGPDTALVRSSSLLLDPYAEDYYEDTAIAEITVLSQSLTEYGGLLLLLDESPSSLASIRVSQQESGSLLSDLVPTVSARVEVESDGHTYMAYQDLGVLDTEITDQALIVHMSVDMKPLDPGTYRLYLGKARDDSTYVNRSTLATLTIVDRERTLDLEASARYAATALAEAFITDAEFSIEALKAGTTLHVTDDVLSRLPDIAVRVGHVSPVDYAILSSRIGSTDGYMDVEISVQLMGEADAPGRVRPSRFFTVTVRDTDDGLRIESIR